MQKNERKLNEMSQKLIKHKNIEKLPPSYHFFCWLLYIPLSINSSLMIQIRLSSVEELKCTREYKMRGADVFCATYVRKWSHLPMPPLSIFLTIKSVAFTG